MKINIVAIGTRMPDWVVAGYAEYAKRLPPHCCLNLIEITAGKRGKNTDIARLLLDEGDRLLNAVPTGCRIIALERRGKPLTTQKLAQSMRAWLNDSQDIALLIGGPEGLSEPCQQSAHEIWSLSGLTMPHPLVRVLMAEQVYRAWSIINNLPYHRDG